jgi:pyruvate formate lyase activating enzyme
MRIGGLEKFSLVDFPGKVAAVVFTQGCNFRCCYCHNPQLVYPHLYNSVLSFDYVMQFLQKRQKQLDGVVVSGGEPTLQQGLIPFIAKLKQLGYLIKLDTNGSKPSILYKLISGSLVDYIAMDIKTSLANYSKVCGCQINIADIKRSIRLIEYSGINYQFRITYDTKIIRSSDLESIKRMIKNPGQLVVQECINKDKLSLQV